MSQLVLDKAISQLNYEETGDNNTKYGAWYGLNNQPWCAIFVSWCYDQSGLVGKVAAQNKKGFASCDAGLKWFTKHNKLVSIGDAQEGDIVFFQFDADAEPDHVGIVAKNMKRIQALRTIEGNTSPSNKGSQSNGGGVYEKKRSYATVMAVVRP
jgi:cell wall-associated NlpC family hydrolase